MKFSLLCLGLSVEALAHNKPSSFKRDFVTITNVLDNVKMSLEKLQVSLTKGLEDPEPLLSASNGLITALESGALKINETTNIDFLDSVRLMRPVHDITALGESLAASLKDKKGSFKEVGLCDVARLQISSISTRSRNLINSVNGKLPEEAQEISVQLTSGLTNVLAQSENQFSEQNCIEDSDGAQTSKAVSSLEGRSVILGVACSLVFLSLILSR